MFKIKGDVSILLFYIALILAEIGWMFTNVNYISKFCNIFVDIAVILLGLCCLIQSRTYYKKSFILILLLVTFFSINAFLIDNNTMLLLLLFCLACKNIDLNKLINFNWKFQMVLIMSVILCYYLGLTNIYYMYRDDGTLRSSMGFSHPNTFGMYLFSTFCQFSYSKYGKVSTKIIIIIGLILSYITSVFSDSRGSVYSFIILLILIGCLNFKKNNFHLKNNFSNFLSIFPIILTILSLVLVLNYDSNNEAMYELNKKLSSRISSAKHIVNDYNVNLFGQKLNLVSTSEAVETGKKALVLDNAYIKIIYQYGIIVYLFFITFYCLIIKKSIKNKNWLLLIMLILYAIRGLTGNVLFNLYGNIFLLFFSKIIYGDDTYYDDMYMSKYNNAKLGDFYE